jgi:cyclic-di-GMP-binding biofilm dispersal mediator protein
MLEQHRYLVVGATGGIGGHLARELAGAGVRLVVSGRASATLETIASETGAVAIPTDLRRPEAAGSLVTRAVRHLDGLDGMVNAAGVVAFGDVVALDDAVLDELVAVDLVAAIRLTRAAARHMNAGGVILNVSAIVAEMPTAGMAAYSAVKAGLTAFDVAAARELRRAGIRLINVRPPHTETGLANRPIAGEAPALSEGRDPADVARRIVAALADPRAREVPFD